jgi:hypothetical protein
MPIPSLAGAHDDYRRIRRAPHEEGHMTDIPTGSLLGWGYHSVAGHLISFDRDTRAETVWPITTNSTGTVPMCVGPDGQLYAWIATTTHVHEINADGTLGTQFDTDNTSFYNAGLSLRPWLMRMDASSRLWIMIKAGSVYRVIRLNADGSFDEEWDVSPATDLDFVADFSFTDGNCLYAYGPDIINTGFPDNFATIYKAEFIDGVGTATGTQLLTIGPNELGMSWDIKSPSFSDLEEGQRGFGLAVDPSSGNFAVIIAHMHFSAEQDPDTKYRPKTDYYVRVYDPDGAQVREDLVAVGNEYTNPGGYFANTVGYERWHEPQSMAWDPDGSGIWFGLRSFDTGQTPYLFHVAYPSGAVVSSEVAVDGAEVGSWASTFLVNGIAEESSPRRRRRSFVWWAYQGVMLLGGASAAVQRACSHA